MEKLKILFLAANSGEETLRRANEEAREISRRLRAGPRGDFITFEPELSVRARDLQYVLLHHQPHILHFSGRGDKKTGILLADGSESPRPVDNKALIEMLRILKDKLRVLVFNACYTKRQARGLTQSFDYTIGMSDGLDDESAIYFSESFYQALGYGRTVVEAFGLACNSLGLEGRAGSNQPFLLHRRGLDTSLPLLPPAGEERPAATFVSAPAIEKTLLIPKRTWNPDFHPPATLLRADFQVVPFFGRTDELEKVDTWINGSAPVGVLLVTGSGGSGKTRFSVEVCLRAKEQELAAGFLSFSQLETSVSQLFQATSRPVLAVLDYAEEQQVNLPILLQAMIAAARSGVTTFRLILLARNAGEWWTLLKSTQGEAGELLQNSKVTERMRLGPIATSDEESRRTYQEAFEAFSAQLGVSRTIDDDEQITNFSREALLIHTQALLRALGEENCPEEEKEVFEFLLNRERSFWRRQLLAHGADIALLPVFEKIVATITMHGGTQDSEYVDEIVTHFRTSFGLDPVTALNLRSILWNTYGDGMTIEPLQPDPLGEHLMAQHMTHEIESLASRR